ncbi:MAG: pectinacetylesterase family protein [Myxococcota bacterium]|nr:pectinacetylesterase family protein [Myxococcota bacterium]MDW8362029.1 pectin acetylesterase-family hydrolase [Myxococcales bacterium]
MRPSSPVPRALLGFASSVLLACGSDRTPARPDAADAASASDAPTPADANGEAGLDAGPSDAGSDASPSSMDARSEESGTMGDGGPTDVPPFEGDAGSCETWAAGLRRGEPITAPPRTWTFVEFPDARCMNDTPTGIGVNLVPGARRVVIFLEGGGACFDFSTCLTVAHQDGFNAATLRSLSLDRGIFRRSDASNPLRDWSYVFVPYCSGDVHAGNTDVRGGPSGRTHRGYINMSRYLERLVPTFEDVELVLLTGSSAGGIGTMANYDQVARAFGCTPVHALDDAGPLFSDTYLRPCLQRWVRGMWNVDVALPRDCRGCFGADGGGIVHMFPYLAAKYPDRRFGLLSTTADRTMRTFFGYGYSPGCDMPRLMVQRDFEAGLRELRDAIMAPYANFRTFYTTGEGHTFLTGSLTVTSGGVTLGEWIRRLVEGDSEWGHVGP